MGTETINSLPVEILECIFSFFSSKELWACLGVNRQWRSVANSERFWKKHCLTFHISEPGVSNLLDESPLCRWASAFYFYFCRPVANWKRGRWHQFDLQLKSTECSQCWSGQFGYIYYYMLGRICIYSVTDDNVLEFVEQLNVDILNQDENHIFPTITCNNYYLAVGNCNIVLIFEKIEGHFRNSHCLALRDEVYCCNDKDDFNLFILTHFSKEYILKTKHFLGHNIWLYDASMRDFIIFDLEKNQVKFKLDYRYVFFRPKIPLLVSLHSKKLEVYNSECEVVLSIDESCTSSVCFNAETLVVSKLSLRSSTTARELQSWDMKTGRHLILIPGGVRAKDLHLSPVSSQLVILRIENSQYSIVSLCARTAVVYWRISESMEHSWFPEIQIVMYEFVFVWPSYNDNDKYSLYELKTGRLIKENKKIQGEPFCITDLLWILDNGSHVVIKSFL